MDLGLERAAWERNGYCLPCFDLRRGDEQSEGLVIEATDMGFFLPSPAFCLVSDGSEIKITEGLWMGEDFGLHGGCRLVALFCLHFKI